MLSHKENFKLSQKCAKEMGRDLCNPDGSPFEPAKNANHAREMIQSMTPEEDVIYAGIIIGNWLALKEPRRSMIVWTSVVSLEDQCTAFIKAKENARKPISNG